MSFYFPNIDQALVYSRKGDATDPYMPLNESSKKVLNGKVILTEIPDFQSDVIVKNSSQVALVETTNETLLTNQFRVDYSVGIVFVHTDLEGQNISIEYMGTGYVSFPAERVWIDGEGAPVTLQNLADKAQETIDNLVGTDVGSIESKIGSLPALQTGNKTSLVQAVNEVHAELDDVPVVTDSAVNGNIIIDGQESVVYTHPANHPASIITQDANNRMVTDAEKATWNTKASTSLATTTANGLMPKEDKAKLNDIDLANKVDGYALQYDAATSKVVLKSIPAQNNSGGAAINDATSTSTTETWSASKIDTELDAKANATHKHALSDLFEPVVQTVNGIAPDANGDVSIAESINVKLLGAMGNEVNDDTAIIQSAINQSSPISLWVTIPKGNYKLTAPLILKEGTKIIMHKDARLVRYHNDNIFQNGVSGDMQGQNNITVLGGKLDLRGHVNKQDGTGFALGYAKNIWIQDVEIYNVYYSHGIELCAVNNAFIERCGFYGYIIDDAGVRDYVEAVQIERGTTTSFPYFGLGDSTICKNIRVHYCKFGASTSAPSWPVAIGSHQTQDVISADNVEIIGCESVDNLTNACIIAKGYKNLTIERNTLKSSRGVLIYDVLATRANVSLRNNIIVAIVGEAVRLEGVDKASVDDNVLIGQTNAINIKSSNVKITESNDLESSTSDAVVIFGQSSFVLCNGATIRKAGRYAFNIYDGAKHVKILNTFIYKATTSAFSLAGSGTKNIVIKGNHIDDSTLTSIITATSGVDRLYFNDNIYPASITTPISSTAVNSDTTGNKTF